MPILIRKAEHKPAAQEAAATAPPPATFMTIKAAAAYAGVSVSSIRRWIKAKRLNAYRAGKQIRLDPSDVVRFMRE